MRREWVSFLFFLFFLFCFEFDSVSCYYYGKVTNCLPQNLSVTGNEMRNKNKTILVQVLAGTQDPICMGRRPDWREGLPQCFQQMTGMDVYASQMIGTNESFMCTSCSSLQEVPCEEVFKREIGVLIVIGGGNKNKEGAGLTCEGVTLHNGQPIPRPENQTIQGPRFSDACILKDNVVTRDKFQIPKNSVLVWFPMVQNTDTPWGMLERGRVFSEDGEQRWTILNDYHFPKISPVFPPPPTPTPPEMLMYVHPPKQDNLFLYISRVDTGKGHTSFLNHILEAPRKFAGNKFRFYIGGSKNGTQFREFWELARQTNNKETNHTVELVKTRLNREGVAEDMRRARGLIHMADTDRNPRIIYEALQEGLPVMTSVQSMVFQAFECAPSSVVRVVDSLAPSYAVGDDFQNFLSGTIDRGRSKEHIRVVVDALQPTSTYPCMCTALNLCEEPIASEAYQELKSVYRTPDLIQPGLNLPKNCHLGHNFEGIQCENSEIFSCLRWASWIEHHRGTAAYLFTSKIQKRSFSIANFLSFSRASCYQKEDRGEFFSLLYPLQPPQVHEAKQELEREQMREVMQEMREWMVKMEGKVAKEDVWKREILKKLSDQARLKRKKGLVVRREEEDWDLKEGKKEKGKKEKVVKEEKGEREGKEEGVVTVEMVGNEMKKRKDKIQMMEDKIQKWHVRDKEREKKEIEHEQEVRKVRQEQVDDKKGDQKRYSKIMEVANSELKAEKELQRVNEEIEEHKAKRKMKKKEGITGEVEMMMEELGEVAELGVIELRFIVPAVFFIFGFCAVVYKIQNMLFKSDRID